MKILYHHRVGSRDGQAVHIDEIIAALRRLGHEVIVVAPTTTQRAEFGADAGFIATLKKQLPAALYELLELGYSALAFWRLWQAYRRERPDVLYERYNLFLLAGTWLARLTGIPLLLEVNSPLVQERVRFGNLANKRLAAWAERTAWRSADYVLPVTQVLAEFIEKAGVGSQRVVVIPNGVGAEFLRGPAHGDEVRARHGIPGRLILGFTGFVREWHGLEQVIDLIADGDRERNLHLLVVGDGPAVPALQAQANARGVGDRVTFAGLVPRDRIIGYVSSFDVALQPKVVPYASPLKLIEYMALGRAIVAPGTPNIRELLSNREALLFDPDDPKAFRSAVETLCLDAALRDRLGKAARAALDRQGLTWAANAARIVSLFEEALRAKGRRRSGEEGPPGFSEAAGTLPASGAHKSER